MSIIPSTTGRGQGDRRSHSGFEREIERGRLPRAHSRWFVTDFTAVLEKDATVDAVNAAFKEASSAKSYKGVVEYSDEPLVSQDIIGNPHSCIFDSKLTLMLRQSLRENRRLV